MTNLKILKCEKKMVFNYEGSMVYLTGYDLINPFMRSLRINGSCYKFVLKKIGSFW